MTRILSLILFLFFLSASLPGQRNDSLKAVLLTATIDETTPSITLMWVARNDAISYSIFRKGPEEHYGEVC